MTHNLYKDTVYGMRAIARNTQQAYILVINECTRQKLEFPPFNKIIFVRQLTEKETAEAFKNKDPENF